MPALQRFVRGGLVSVADAVRSAANPQAAMLAIAEALDRIEAAFTDLTIGKPDLDAWGSWTTTDPIASVEADEDHVEVTFTPTGDPVRRGNREALAENYEWHTELDPDVVTAYIVFGPAYIYEYDRDFVMQQAPEVRKALVEDLLLDDPKRAHEMARDILKDERPGTLPKLAED